MAKPLDPLAEADRQLSEFGSEQDNGLPGLKNAGKRFIESAETIERSFSGSCAGYHGRLYFNGFKQPPTDQRFSVEWGTLDGMPEGWSEKTPEEVKEEIERLSGGASVDSYEEKIEQLRKRTEALRDDLGSYLTLVVRAPGLEAEKATLEGLMKFKFGRIKGEYIKANMPSRIMSRDSEAAMQGICIPSHLYYQAVGYEGSTVCESVQDFLAQSNRLLRQIRLKATCGATEPLKQEGLEWVSELLAGFHRVARQLFQRQRDRRPFEIRDEYDVQDLLHGLLRLRFDDVRAEEVVPSYAGVASRIDFLLKSEKIVVHDLRQAS